jgi:hypothetical protein
MMVDDGSLIHMIYYLRYRQMMLGVCDKLSMHQALRPKDLAHEELKHRGICFR